MATRIETIKEFMKDARKRTLGFAALAAIIERNADRILKRLEELHAPEYEPYVVAIRFAVACGVEYVVFSDDADCCGNVVLEPHDAYAIDAGAGTALHMTDATVAVSSVEDAKAAMQDLADRAWERGDRVVDLAPGWDMSDALPSPLAFRLCQDVRFDRPVDLEKITVAPGDYRIACRRADGSEDAFQLGFTASACCVDEEDPCLLHCEQGDPDYAAFPDLYDLTADLLRDVVRVEEWYVDVDPADGSGRPVSVSAGFQVLGPDGTTVAIPIEVPIEDVQGVIGKI